jgi:hypothetical protein
MSRTTWRLGIAVIPLLLVGCSSGTPTGVSTPSASTLRSSVAPATTQSPTASAASSTPADTATGVAKRLQAVVPSARRVVTITEDNDPNDLIGRPNGYIDAAVIYDSEVHCTELGLPCGATIEIWPSEVDATARKEYIQTTLKANRALGTEYDTVHGSVLLRVSGQVKPSRAKTYATAFTS